MRNDHPEVARFRLTKVIGGYRIDPLSAADIPLIREFCQSADERSRLRKGDLALLISELMCLATQRGFELQPKGQLACPTLHLSRLEPPPATSPWKAFRGKYCGTPRHFGPVP